MQVKDSKTSVSSWERIKKYAHFIKILLKGDQYEWVIDLHKANRPVLLIQGFAMPRQGMAVLEKRLTDDGYDVFSFRLGAGNFLGLDKASRIIGMKLRNLNRTSKVGKVAIVGHSLGGMIGRTFVSLRRGNRLCHTLITLGSPHQGHPAGKYGRFNPIAWFSEVPGDLLPDSPIMKILKHIQFPSDVYCASIYSDRDTICPENICPLSIPEDAHNLVNVPVPGMNHTDLLVDLKVYDVIKEHLDEGFRRAGEFHPDPDETLPTWD